MSVYPSHLPSHRVHVEPDLVLRALMRACHVLTTESPIWRDGHCVLCGMADDGAPLPAHEDDCAVQLARRAFAAGMGER